MINKFYILFASLILAVLFTFKDTNKILVYQFLISGIDSVKKIGVKNNNIAKYKVALKYKKQLLVKKLFYKKINILWKKDLHNLIKKNIPPKEWHEIKSIEWNNKELAKYLKPPVTLKKEGNYHLKIYTYLLNENYSALVIQYDLINTQNKNLIWEFSRTFKTRP